MRIVLATGIYPPEIGGPATVTPLLAEAAYRRGWKTRVVTYGDASTDRSGSWELAIIEKQQSIVRRYSRFFWQVWRWARESDVIFLQGTFVEGLPGLLAAKLAGCPAVLRMPGCFAHDRWQSRTGRLISIEEFISPLTPRPTWVSVLSWLERIVLRSVERVFLPSKYFLPLLKAWGVDTSRLRTIYNVPESLPVLEMKEVLRERLSLPLNGRVFLTLARGILLKRVDFLIELLPHLPDVILVALGEGEAYVGWRARAEELGVSDRFLTPGRVDRSSVFRYAKAADAFLLASHAENYPFAAIEMVVAGLPCFLSDRGGNIEAAEQFPKQIHLLPYAKLNEWVEALRAPIPLVEPVQSGQAPRMVDRYLDEIERTINPMS